MYYDNEVKRKIRNIEREARIKQKKEHFEKKKARSKTYLKGQYGKRLYYDYEKKYVDDSYNGFENLPDENDPETANIERQVKCVYTKDLRLEKLFGYLKYLNGKEISIRDLAFHYAVTERTMQHDLRWLENNGYITIQKNKNEIGKQTKNSYFVNPEKEKDLPCEDTFLCVAIISKIDNEYYVLTETEYTGKRTIEWVYNPNWNIDDYEFDLPYIAEKYPDRIDKHSLKIAKEIFNVDLKDQYKGHILTHIQKQKVIEMDIYGNGYNSYSKEKYIFTLFLLDNIKRRPKGYYWLKMSVAPRRIKNRAVNKCIKHIKENILG